MVISKLLVLCLAFVSGIIVQAKLTKKQANQIKESGLLTVVGSSQLADYQMEEKCCFSIQIEDKNKRKGYTLIKRKFQAIRKYLNEKGLIPQTNILRPAKSEVKMNHHRKVWSFKRIICFITENKKVEVKNILQKQGIKQISFQPTEELTQYDYFTKAFIDAKKKAQSILQEMQYRIQRIQQVNILSGQIQLQQYHQSMYSKIEHDQSSKSEDKSKDQSHQEQSQSEEEEKQQAKHVELEVTFVVQSLDEYQSMSRQQNKQSNVEEGIEQSEQL